MEQKQGTNEIDLMELLARFFAALKRNLVLTILLPLLGALAAFLFYNNDEDYYGSSMLIETSLLSENECQFLFEQLEMVDTLPGLSTADRQRLSSLKYEVIRNEATDTADKSVYLKVTAKVNDIATLKTLDDVIVRFLNESSPVVRHRNEREQFYSQMITRIDAEIAAMDLVKKDIGKNTQATYLNPADLYANTVKLYKERTEYELKREEIKSIHLVKGFDSLTRNVNTPFILVLAGGFIAGTLFLFFVIFVRFFFKYYRQIENKL